MTCHVELLEGLGGDVTSPGVITMANRINTWPGLKAIVSNWSDWQAAAARLSALAPTDKACIVGYSNGGSLATYVTAQGMRIDLLFGLDATIWIPPKAIPASVAKAICFWNVNPFSSLPPVGHARYTLADGNNKTKLLTRKIYNSHMTVDTDPKIQDAVYQACKDAQAGI